MSMRIAGGTRRNSSITGTLGDHSAIGQISIGAILSEPFLDADSQALSAKPIARADDDLTCRVDMA